MPSPGLYKDNDNENELSTIDDIVENISEEVHSADSPPKKPTCNVGKLNLEVLKKAQQWHTFYKNESWIWKRSQTPTSYWTTIASLER